MGGPHQRNTAPMLSSPRCGGRTRRGTLCRARRSRASIDAVCMRAPRDLECLARTETR